MTGTTDLSAPNPPEVVIIGAGPAGLTAAYILVTRYGIPSTVLEADSQVGGISRTVERDGWRFDIGGHRFFTKVKEVDELWHEILPDEDFMLRPRDDVGTLPRPHRGQRVQGADGHARRGHQPRRWEGGVGRSQGRGRRSHGVPLRPCRLVDADLTASEGDGAIGVGHRPQGRRR